MAAKEDEQPEEQEQQEQHGDQPGEGAVGGHHR